MVPCLIEEVFHVSEQLINTCSCLFLTLLRIKKKHGVSQYLGFSQFAKLKQKERKLRTSSAQERELSVPRSYRLDQEKLEPHPFVVESEALKQGLFETRRLIG
jgi:hypothetical protein